MALSQPGASILIPDGIDRESALQRVTHLGVGAHPDDLEIMAYHGIAECLHAPALWFGGITCTDGAGCARSGPYCALSNEGMRIVRQREQEAAALVGRYGVQVQLDYASKAIEVPNNSGLVEDLAWLLAQMNPRVVYTHNPADEHTTHIHVLSGLIEAVRTLPLSNRPEAVYGCEVWRGLEWLVGDDKVVFDVSAHESLAVALLAVFDSQIAGGKRYDLASIGRRLANATYLESHQTDHCRQVSFAMDLTPLVRDDSLGLLEFVEGHLDRFSRDVRQRLEQASGS